MKIGKGYPLILCRKENILRISVIIYHGEINPLITKTLVGSRTEVFEYFISSNHCVKQQYTFGVGVKFKKDH